MKLCGRKIGYRYLLHKLQNMWQFSEELVLMDIGNDFYLISFKNENNYIKVFHGGP